MGKVDNNIVEVETNFENKIEKLWFVLQDAVFIVSNEQKEEAGETGVYIYAKRVQEISKDLTLETITKQYEEKVEAFELEKQQLAEQNIDPLNQSLNAKLFVLKEDVNFLKKVVSVVKEFKL